FCFSSRRRHTMSKRDWSSDVCSSDLIGFLARTPKLYQGHIVLEVEFQEPNLVASDEPASRMRSMFLASQEALRTIEQNLTNRTRSEERRVGKVYRFGH